MKTKILSLFILTAVILTAIASATVYEPNYVYDGNTKEALTGVSVIGYIYQDEAYDTATRLWPATMNTGNDNIIVLSYPTYLLSDYGYVIYFFKEGYVPYKVKADWYGEGRTQDYKNYLYKISDKANAPIDNFQISKIQIKTNEQVKITANILSPRINKDNIQFIPEELKTKYYSDNVKVTLEVNGNVVETKNLNMFWSTEQNVEFSWKPTAEGTYKIKLITKITDSKFLSTQEKSAEKDVVVKGEAQLPVDNVKPVITINYPMNGKTYGSYITELKYTATDENLKSCFYSTNNKDKIAVSCNDAIKGLESKQGTNTWTIYAEDSYGNSAEKSITFTIKLDDEDNQNKTSAGYRNLNRGDTWEEEQYQNQFKPVVLTGESDESVKLSAWQKFIDWIKYVFRSLFWFLD